VLDLGTGQAVLHITTAPEDLARLYSWLETSAEACHLPKSVLQGMHIVLEEAVTNVAMHAFPPGEQGEVTIRLQAAPGAASLVVEDSGRPFDPTAAPAHHRPASLLEAEPGGLGLTLLRHYCRDIGYERIGDRNRLTLRFPLPQALGPG
jgi:anti-sigma regulatory factor (Ser/Thr protein kinase)